MTGNPRSLGVYEDEDIAIETITLYNKKSIITRFSSWILGTIQVIWKACFKYRNCDFFLVSNPPTIHLFGYLCKHRYSALVYDVYPDGIVTGGFVKRSNPIFKLWTVFEKADHVYAISEGIAEKVSQYCPSEKIKVVPLWSNKDIHRIKKTDNLFVRTHNLYGKFVILYSGNIGKGSNIKVLIELAKEMKYIGKVQFIVIGEGMEKPLVKEAIKSYELTNILLLPYQPVETLSHSLSSADLAYVSVEDKAANVCIPSKTFNLLNVEAPLFCIASRNAEITRFIERYNIGKVFQASDISGMKSFIESMVNNEKALSEYKDNIRKSKKDYSYLNATKFVTES